jgi:hypothetical protein
VFGRDSLRSVDADPFGEHGPQARARELPCREGVSEPFEEPPQEGLVREGGRDRDEKEGDEGRVQGGNGGRSAGGWRRVRASELPRSMPRWWSRQQKTCRSSGAGDTGSCTSSGSANGSIAEPVAVSPLGPPFRSPFRYWSTRVRVQRRTAACAVSAGGDRAAGVAERVTVRDSWRSSCSE